MDRVLPYKLDTARSWWQRAMTLGKQLRSERFDLVVVSNPVKEFHVGIWAAGIPCRVGYHQKWGWALTHRLPKRQVLGERHEVEYNLDLVRRLGLPTHVPTWQWKGFEKEQDEVSQLLGQQGVQSSESFMAVHPWTSNPSKQWPLERYRALIQRVVEHLPVRVVVVGGTEVNGQPHAVLPTGMPVVNLTGRTSLTQLAALLQRAKLLVSNDSGPVHLAAALGTRCVVLFGTSDPWTGPRRWGPWGMGHEVIHRPTMDAITVDEVMEAVYRVWR